MKAPRRFLLAVLFCLRGAFAFPQDISTPFGVTGLSGAFSIDESAALLVAEMSDEDALAQTFMFGWAGTEPSPLILSWIKNRRIGGIKVFGWNTRTLPGLASAIGVMQKEALASPLGIPLLVATDQEGGIVRHVKDGTSDAPGNMAAGASAFPRDAYLTGYYLGRELALLGINMNFAPVVDLADTRDSEVIGVRSFGSDPVRAGILGTAFMKGQAAAGIIATAKHFPGHGGTGQDSHGTLPRIRGGEESLWERELVPYRMMVREELPAVMSGHIAFPGTPGGETPASLSPWFLDEVLRKRMGFKGLVITDDLMMYGALNAAGNLPEAVRRALLAGNDMILVSSTPELNDALWTKLLFLMYSDSVFRDRVRSAARRVVALKLQSLRLPGAVPPVPDPVLVRRGIPDPEGRSFFLSLAARSITVLKNSDPGGKAIPLTPERAGKVLLAGQFPAFFNAGRAAFPGAALYTFSSGSRPGEFRSRAAAADTVVFCLAGQSDVPGGEAALLKSLENLNKRIIVMVAKNPGIRAGVDASAALPDYLSPAGTALALYSYSEESFIAGFSALLGRFQVQGRVP